ncbi:MAG TPA: hypothetical protein PKD92_03510 [Novosphingobium sp.]|nr:hypothetical protein [Novosphingobium sp.]HMP55621.1 hypothetical protein [Novosphingobium sp.]
MTTTELPRRGLVLTDETARHPFLASLPPWVRASVEPVAVPGRKRRVTARDWRDFLTAYCASFVAVMIFLA